MAIVVYVGSICLIDNFVFNYWLFIIVIDGFVGVGKFIVIR